MVHHVSKKGKKMGGDSKIPGNGTFVPAAHLFSPPSSGGAHHSAANAVSERNLQRFITILTLAVLACLCLPACHKKPAPIVITPDIEKNHLQRNHIFGKVKTLETKTCNIWADSVSVADTSDLEKLKKYYDLDEYFSNSAHYLQRYTSDGYLLEHTKYGWKGKDGIYNYTQYKYADDAKIERWDCFDSNDRLLTYCLYHYDRNRFLAKEEIFQTYDDQDSLELTFTHTTDGIGNIIRTVKKYSQTPDKFLTEYHYNDQGLVYEIVEHEPNGDVFKTAKIEYDNYGDEVNRCVYKAGDQMIEYTYTEYAQDGRVRKVIYEDKLHHVKEFHYFFDYDANKNWQTEVCAVDGQIVYVKQRTFEYYDR